MPEARLEEIRAAAEQYAGSLLVRNKPNSAIAHRGELLAEIDRLGALLAELLEEQAEKFVDATTLFRGLNVRDGQVHLEIEPAREMILIWCASVRAMLDEHQAVNYTETELTMPRQDSVSLDIQDGQNPTDSYTLTLQRRHGKTPHQLRLQAERERDEALAELEQFGDVHEQWATIHRDTGYTLTGTEEQCRKRLERSPRHQLHVRDVRYGPWRKVGGDNDA
jgi:hypothetical protein